MKTTPVLYPSPELVIFQQTKDLCRGKILTEKGWQKFWFSRGDAEFYLRLRGKENHRILKMLEGQIGKPEIIWRVSGWFQTETLHFWSLNEKTFENFRMTLYQAQKESSWFQKITTLRIERKEKCPA